MTEVSLALFLEVNTSTVDHVSGICLLLVPVIYGYLLEVLLQTTKVGAGCQYDSVVAAQETGLRTTGATKRVAFIFACTGSAACLALFEWLQAFHRQLLRRRADNAKRSLLASEGNSSF